MTGWIRNCPFLIWIVLASQAVAQEDSAAKAPSPSVRQLEYALRIASAQRDFSHNFVARARQLLELCPEDQRRWEWHYLRRLCNSELKSVQVPERIDEVLLSPDGSRYALISRRRIAVRSLSRDKDIFELKGFVRDAAFSQDGQTLAVAGARSVSLVDASDGTPRKKIELPKLWERERIVCVCLSPSGDRLGVVQFFSDNSNLQRMSELTIWDVDSAKPVRAFGAVPPSTVQVRFSPDGKLVATGSAGMGAENTHWPGEIRIWDLETGKRVQMLQIYHPSVLPDGYFLTDFVFSHDGAHVVTASNGGDVMVWEVSSGRKIHTLNAHKGPASVGFDGSGSRIVSGGEDRIIRVWDMATGVEINSMRGQASSIKSVAFLDDQRIASVGRNIRIWDAAAPQPARTYQGDHRGSVVYGIAFGPKSDLLGTASMHVGRIRDVKRGSIRYEIPTGSDRPGSGMAFSADGRLFGTTDRDGGKLWNVETGDLVHKLPDGVNDLHGSIFSIAFAPAGPLVATSGQDQLAIWNQKTGQPVRKIKMARGGSECVAFSPNAKHVVTGHEGYEPIGKVVPGEVNFWDVETGKLKLTITAGGTGNMGISFDPDGRRIAVTVDDRVTLFDTGNGAKLLELRGHWAGVNGVAFSPDGDRIATGSTDHTVRIWDAHSGQELLSLHGHDWPVLRVAFSPNGLHLASSAGPGVVTVWDATPPGKLGLQALAHDEKAE
jgi:WD40 repeat protein